MKKLVILASFLALWACKKDTALSPDPLPENVVEVPPAEDTTKHNLINDWNNYQYKYTYQGNTWINTTAWNVRVTRDTIMFDEGKDGGYEKKYPISIQSTPQLTIMTITYPGPTPKYYEVRATRVGKKQGYDLIGAADQDQDIYSLIK